MQDNLFVFVFVLYFIVLYKYCIVFIHFSLVHNTFTGQQNFICIYDFNILICRVTGTYICQINVVW